MKGLSPYLEKIQSKFQKMFGGGDHYSNFKVNPEELKPLFILNFTSSIINIVLKSYFHLTNLRFSSPSAPSFPRAGEVGTIHYHRDGPGMGSKCS